MRTLEDIVGKTNPTTLSTSLAAQVWGVGKAYVDQSALNDPPIAPSNRMHLPSAVAHVGRCTDPDWGDWERVTLHYPSPPVEPKLNVANLLSIASRTEPKSPPKVIDFSSPGKSRGRNGSADWRADYERRKKEWDAKADERLEAAKGAVKEEEECYRKWREGIEIHAPGVCALEAAFRALAKSVLDGQVTPYFRPADGGKMQPLEPSVFTRGGISVGAIRTGTYEMDDKRYHLFVDAEQLGRVFPVQSRPGMAIEGVPLESLSPHLQLMIAVALESGIAEDTYIETSQLAADMMAKAASFGLRVGRKGDTHFDISLSQCEKLAPALRWPNARAGKAVVAKQKR